MKATAARAGRIKILIADDTTLIRRLLANQLANEPDFQVVGEAGDGIQAVDLARSLCPDIILMDLEMPHLNGIKATEKILAQQDGVRVILLTSHEQLAPLGSLSGASACLNKGCTPQELVDTIRNTYAERLAAPTPSPATGFPPTLQRLAERAGLTERERAVAEKMAVSELTAAEIARELAGETGAPVTESAVKHALERAMTKLEIEPRTRASLVRHVFDTR